MLNRFKASKKFIIDIYSNALFFMHTYTAGLDIERAIEQHGTNPYILCTGKAVLHVARVNIAISTAHAGEDIYYVHQW